MEKFERTHTDSEFKSGIVIVNANVYFRSWTNYTTCMDLTDVKFHYAVNMMTLVFLILSLVSLLFSLAIFMFKSLRCTRNSVHTHMFTSLALNNISWITW